MVLFVCKSNVGRSQMASAMYNAWYRRHLSDSAGTQVDQPGESLAEHAAAYPGKTFVVPVMAAQGLDVRSCRRVQLTESILGQYDLIVAMTKLNLPRRLARSSQLLYWPVPDPSGRSFAETERARQDILRRLTTTFFEANSVGRNDIAA